MGRSRRKIEQLMVELHVANVSMEGPKTSICCDSHPRKFSRENRQFVVHTKGLRTEKEHKAREEVNQLGHVKGLLPN